MATNRWFGDYPARARVVTLTVGGTVGDTDTVTYTIGGIAVTATAVVPSDTKALLAAKLYDALIASDDPRFKEVTWTYTTDDEFVTGTAATPGVPFAGTATDSGTTTLTEAVVTESTGPSHVDEPLNWSLGAVPGATDDVLIDGGEDGLYGFDGLSAAAYTSFRVKASFEGKSWGLPYRNAGGYVEYRTRFHPMATAIPTNIGEGDGNGPSFVNLTITTAIALVVHKTGNRLTPTVPVVNVKGMASGTIDIASGDVGVGADDDTSTGTVTTATLNEDCTLTVGKGCTVTTCNNDGGAVLGYGTVTTLNQTAGTATAFVAPTTITADGGAVNVRFTGTVTTVTARGQGNSQLDPKIDCTLDPRDRTFTNASFTGGANLQDPDKTVIFTNAITTDRASLAASDLGARLTLQRT